MSGIKDIKLRSSEDEFTKRFAVPSKKLHGYAAQRTIISYLPRYLFEVIAFGGIVGIIISLLSTTTLANAKTILPVISLYVMAGYRLMPALQQIYSGVTNIKFNHSAFETLVLEFSSFTNEKVKQRKHARVPFKDKFEISQLSFSYENSHTKILDELNLIVYPNTTVGIVGSTGAGKTTLIDLILGLLVPESGSVSLDGVEINKHNISAWQNNIGYVPQSIYLTDDTIEANIAFAKSRDEINIDKAIKAAKLANLHEFITTLPEQYKTFVGERGVRLSGGQRQRIGIARALYHDPTVLVLDEATSSLDGITENAIMDAINNLSHEKTIIMIAHRLSTVKECDIIHFMSNGQITDSGTYQQLIDSNEEFKTMADHL
jgi:ABC-type multidrug transport system fused ATPase/permease subunit